MVQDESNSRMLCFSQNEIERTLEVLDRIFQDNPAPKKNWRINRLKLEEAMHKYGISTALSHILIEDLVRRRVFRRGKKFVRIKIFVPLVGEQHDELTPNEHLHTTEKRWTDFVKNRRATADQEESVREKEAATMPRFTSASGAVELFGINDPPIVKDIRQQVLSTTRYNVIQALCEAGEVGLTKDTFVSVSGHADARGILNRLSKVSPQWKAVIKFPGHTGGRYRVL